MTHDEILKHTRVMIRLTVAAQRARSLSAFEDATNEVEMMKRLEYARAISESQLFKAQQACQALAAAPKTPANATFSRCLKLARIDSVEVVQKLASESCQWTNSGMTKGDTARAKALLAKVWLQLDRLALHIGYWSAPPLERRALTRRSPAQWPFEAKPLEAASGDALSLTLAMPLCARPSLTKSDWSRATKKTQLKANGQQPT